MYYYKFMYQCIGIYSYYLYQCIGILFVKVYQCIGIIQLNDTYQRDSPVDDGEPSALPVPEFLYPGRRNDLQIGPHLSSWIMAEAMVAVSMGR